MNTHPKMNYIYIGVDCHKQTHTATLINCFNEKYETITFNNDLTGYKYLVETVEKHKSDRTPIYGLEDTKHLGYGLASFLLSKSYIVKNVNSNLTYVERKKNPIITKNDELDSVCIAKVLLDELDNLQNAQSDEIYWTLKQLVKMRKAIVYNNVEYKNKLHAQLMHHYPNYNKMFVNIYCKTALAIWEKYPSPSLILEEDFDTFVSYITKASNGKLGLKKATQILEFIKEYNLPYQVYQTERNCIIKMLVKQIIENNERLEGIEKEIISVYDKIGCKLHTYPCLDKISGAYILSEIGNIGRFKDSGKLARYAGIAPIERSSGGIDKAIKNEFGNRDLNSMIYKLACRSLCTGKTGNTPFNAIFLEYYHKKISEGKTTHQAIVCIMRRIVNILYRMLKNNTEYKHPKDLTDACLQKYFQSKEEAEQKQKEKELKKQKHTNKRIENKATV